MKELFCTKHERLGASHSFSAPPIYSMWVTGESNWQPLSASVFLQYSLMLCIWWSVDYLASCLHFWVKENKSEGPNVTLSGYNWGKAGDNNEGYTLSCCLISFLSLRVRVPTADLRFMERVLITEELAAASVSFSMKSRLIVLNSLLDDCIVLASLTRLQSVGASAVWPKRHLWQQFHSV